MNRKKRPAARDYLRVVEWSEKDGCFIGSAPPLIGPCCHGATEVSVLRQLRKIVDEWLAIHDQDKSAPPSPLKGSGYSGRFVLRVPPPVHQALALKAREVGKSLNTYCAERLAEGWS